MPLMFKCTYVLIFKYSMVAHIIQLTSVYLQSGIFCIIVDALIKLEIYSDYVQVCISWLQSNWIFVIVNTFKYLFIWGNNLRHGELQEHLAPSGYLKIPTVSIMYLLSIFLIMRNALFMLFG